MLRIIRFLPGLVLSTILTGASVSANQLAPTPVQDAMRASVGLASWRQAGEPNLSSNDEFGGVSGQAGSGKKSVLKAALYSALIPGGGQYYLGKRRTARYFFTAEALTWLGYFSLRTYGSWRKDNYIDYAAIHANAQLEGKDEEYLAWVGFYDNIREFNNLGRAWDPEREYLPDIPEYHWDWQSLEERRTYRDLRNSSKEAYRRAEFMIGLAVIDRIISIVDAVRSTGKINRRIGGDEFSSGEDRNFRLSVNPFSSRRQICLTVYPGF